MKGMEDTWNFDAPNPTHDENDLIQWKMFVKI